MNLFSARCDSKLPDVFLCNDLCNRKGPKRQEEGKIKTEYKDFSTPFDLNKGNFF